MYLLFISQRSLVLKLVTLKYLKTLSKFNRYHGVRHAQQAIDIFFLIY